MNSPLSTVQIIGHVFNTAGYLLIINAGQQSLCSSHCQIIPVNHSSSHSTNSPMTCEWSAPACRWSSSWLLICLGIQCQQSWRFFNNSQQHLKYTCHCLLLIHIHEFHCISIILLVTWHFFCCRCHSHTDRLTQTQSRISLLLLSCTNHVKSSRRLPKHPWHQKFAQPKCYNSALECTWL